MRRLGLSLAVPLAGLLVAVLQMAGGGCSSSSELYGGGGVEAFCTKWTGAHCQAGPTKEECMNEYGGDQSACPFETNALFRCATLEANIACETGTRKPRIVGCAPREVALRSCLTCADLCKQVVRAECATSPSQDECITACADQRCASSYQRLANCPNLGYSLCIGGNPIFNNCRSEYNLLAGCVGMLGTAPFHVIPPPVADTGPSDAEPEAGGGFAPDIGGFGK